ncbi:MAG: patatin-like phospholipase family protein [Deltaproteobacteria bacterium]|nr:patatin-like phospholipase family protein [Deltaproteobacteria bacterium]
MKKIKIFPRLFFLGPALLLAALVATGCAHYPANPLLKEVVPDEGYRMRNVRPAGNSDQILMILTFSGGGTRAAALAYGVMEELARTEIRFNGRKGMLLDEVDAISGVSGGSVIAAYYGLFGKRLFEDFDIRFLKKNIQNDLLKLPFKPGNWFRLWAPHFARTDLVAEYFDQNLYDCGTFGDIVVRKGPMIFINATDVTQGSHFTFCQDLFDILCSDLSRFPVARAVAASAAVPILLSPITLYNYAGSCSYREPEWVQQVLEDPHSSRRRYQQALQLKSYMDAERKPYIHLVDGGIADNLGLRAAIDRLLPQGELWPLLSTWGWKTSAKLYSLP